MAYALAVGTLSFLFSVLGGPPLIAFLRRQRMGKRIREEGPQSHNVKAGTPTMGGLLIFLSVFIVTVPLNLIERLSILLPTGVLVLTGLLGLFDDLQSLIGSIRQGIRARLKFFIHSAIAIGAAIGLYFFLGLSTVNVPFLGRFEIGWAYLPIAYLAIVGFGNAVNITDGLDGLAGGTSAIAFATYGIIALLQGQDYLVTFCFTVVGAILGFLWFNAHPAQIFMGDTGSLALGSTLAVVAFMTGWWLLLPLIGIVFVVETLSVILQVAYFRFTGGKRLFRMSPLHHHFELSGWAETQVTARFWLVGIVGAMLGIAGALS